MRLAVTTAALAVASVATMGAVAAAGDDAPAVTTVVLVARHSRFEPDRITVPAGTTVRFVVHNRDPIDHELIVGDAATHRRHEVGRESHHHGDVPGEVSIPAGTTAVTTYRSQSRNGVLFACHLPGHLAYGMAGTITFE